MLICGQICWCVNFVIVKLLGALASCIGSLSRPVYQKRCSLRCMLTLLWSSTRRLSVRSFYTLISKHILNYVCVLNVKPHQSNSVNALSRTVNMVVITSCMWVQQYASVFHVWPVSTCPDASEESLDFLVLSICTLNLAGTITAFRLHCNGCVLFTC